MRAGVFTAIVWLIFGPGVERLRADGGVVRYAEQHGPLRITVFTQPTPCRVGPVDVSVLVQDAASGTPLTTAAVAVEVNDVRQAATTEAAVNKLLQATAFDIPSAGRWPVEVIVTIGAEAASCAFVLDVEEAAPPWRSYALWIGWPALVILVFAVHQYLVRRRRPLAA